jgi:hypothetical protein
MESPSLEEFNAERATLFAETDILRGDVRRAGPSAFATAEALDRLNAAGDRLERMRKVSWPACLPNDVDLEEEVRP